jgi:hypothetical protein
MVVTYVAIAVLLGHPFSELSCLRAIGCDDDYDDYDDDDDDNDDDDDDDDDDGRG